MHCEFKLPSAGPVGYIFPNQPPLDEGAFPWLNIADSFLLKITYRSRNRVGFPMGDDTFSSIRLDTSRRLDELMHIDSISCANTNSFAAPNHLSLRAFPPSLAISL
jgi:hypothetical protein